MARGQPECPATEALGHQVGPTEVQFRGKGPCFLVEEEGHLTVHEEVVVDGGQACVDLQLSFLVAQVHGRCQRQLVIPSSIKWVLWVDVFDWDLADSLQWGGWGGYQEQSPRTTLSQGHSDTPTHSA